MSFNINFSDENKALLWPSIYGGSTAGAGIGAGWSSLGVSGQRSPRRQTHTRYQYRHSRNPDLSTRAGYRSDRNTAGDPYVLPEARFDELGGVRQVPTVNAPAPLRLLSENGGRRRFRGSMEPDTGTVRSSGELGGTWGLVLTAGTASAYRDSLGAGRSLVTSAAAGNHAGLEMSGLGAGYTQPIQSPYFTAKLMLTSVSDVRFWLGFTETSQLYANTDGSTARQYIAIRYSTSVPDAAFMLITHDGDGSPLTTTSTGVVPVADKWYTFELYSDGSKAYASINGSQPVSSSTNHPATTQSLNLGPSYYITSLAAAAKGVISSTANWIMY